MMCEKYAGHPTSFCFRNAVVLWQGRTLLCRRHFGWIVKEDSLATQQTAARP